MIFTLFISLSFRLFTSRSDRRQIWPIALHHIDHVTWSKSEKLIHRYTSDLSTRPRKNITFSLVDCSILFTWPIVLYDWSRLALVLFLLIIHTKIKSIFSTGLPSLSFSFTFSPCNLFLLFHNELLRSLLLIGSLRHLLYLWIQFACLISFNVPHLALTFFFFQKLYTILAFLEHYHMYQPDSFLGM